MPDIKTVTINDTVYDIKDEIARNSISDLKSNIQENTDNIDSIKGEKKISIPLPMEVGGLGPSFGQDIDSTNRARTVGVVAFSLACPIYHFPEGTKHRFCYKTGTDTFISMSDWSELTEDSIKTDWEENFPQSIGLRILVGYTDNRTITSENIPVVTCEYTLKDEIDGFSGWAVAHSTQYNRLIYKNTTSQTFSISPIIPVEYGKTYRTNSARNLVFYDEALKHVDVITGPNQAIDITFTVTNANAKYIIYCYHTDTGKNYFEEADGFIGGDFKTDSLPYSLAGKRLSLLGDSISAYSGLIPSGNASYYSGSNHGVIDPAQMWWNVLCAKTGMIPLIINADSGAAITQLEDSDHSSKVPMSADAKCSALNNGDINPDVIIIEGGINDYTYAQSAQSEPLAWNGKTAPVLGNSFTEAYACMIKKLQTNYPNAIIVALSTPFTMRGTDNGYTLTHTVGSNVYTQADYDEAIKNVCEQMHIPYVRIDDIGMSRSNMYPTYAEDSSTTPAHPNAKGQMLLGSQLATRLPIAINGYLNQL